MGGIIDTINLYSLLAMQKVQTLADYTEWDKDPDVDGGEAALESNFTQIMDKLNTLIDSVWKWVIIGLAAVVALWGAYIGIRIAIAHRNEDKINSRDMLKNLLIGVIVIFVVAMGVPLIIKALYAWA